MNYWHVLCRAVFGILFAIQDCVAISVPTIEILEDFNFPISDGILENSNNRAVATLEYFNYKTLIGGLQLEGLNERWLINKDLTNS